MLARTVRSLIIACLFVGSLSAGSDPLVGKWKLDQSKSKIAGEPAEISALGGNKYTIRVGDVSDTIVADGTDQPVHFGRTESITQRGSNTWAIVLKKDGRTLGAATWILSQDGKTINITGTIMRPDGSTSNYQFAIKRIAGTSGFAGTWEISPAVFEIQPYEGDGLSLIHPAEKDTLSMKFDGKDYPEEGPNVTPGSVSSGRRVNDRTLELTDKVQGKVMDTTEFKVSSDGKTLTLTVQQKGQDKPLIFIYDRE